MIAKIMAVSKIALVLAVLFLTVRLGILVGHIDETAKKTQVTVTKLNQVLDDADSTVTELRKVEVSARIASDEVTRAALDEQFYFDHSLPALLSQVSGVLNETQNTVSTLSGNETRITDATVQVLNTTNEQLGQFGPVLGQAKLNLVQLQATEEDLNKVLLNPDITNTLHNLNEGTASIAGTAQDVQQQVHSLVHPTPLVNIVNWTLRVGQVVGAWTKGIF